MKSLLKKFYKIRNPEIVQIDSNDKMNIGYGSLNYKIICGNKTILVKVYKLIERNLSFVKSENKIINLQPLGPQKIQYLGKLKNYYKSNYLCMIKKINKFIKFLNIFDPEAVVVIQAGYNVPVFSKDSVRNDYNIFTLVKATEKCKKKLSQIFNA